MKNNRWVIPVLILAAATALANVGGIMNKNQIDKLGQEVKELKRSLNSHASQTETPSQRGTHSLSQ